MIAQAGIWRDLARQAAESASQFRSVELRVVMLSIAAGYERLAELAEKSHTEPQRAEQGGG